MRSSSRRSFALHSAVCGALLACALEAEPACALRLAGRALDLPAEIEVRDLPDEAAKTAIEAAFAELGRAPLVLRALEEAAATGRPVALDAVTKPLVERALGFCFWSEGVVGPLGGELFRLLGLRAPVTALPTPEALDAATSSARCEHASYDAAAATLTVASGTRLDFFPFETGWAVDRAVEILRARGAVNLDVVVGNVRRSQGGGLHGAGWRVDPAPAPGADSPVTPFYLRDRAFALVSPGDRPLKIAGDSIVPYVDQRSGRTAGGVAQLYVVAELGADAEALAYAMFALGPGNGTLRLGGLTPRPSILWLLGNGEGPPVTTDYNWSAVPRH